MVTASPARATSADGEESSEGRTAREESQPAAEPETAIAERGSEEGPESETGTPPEPKQRPEPPAGTSTEPEERPAPQADAEAESPAEPGPTRASSAWDVPGDHDRSAEEGRGAQGGAPPSPREAAEATREPAAPPEPGRPSEEPGSGPSHPREDDPVVVGGAADVADRVYAVLSAAEASAEAIRRKAEADWAVEERRRAERADRELDHLSRLADALAVQAEAVKRQCAVVRRIRGSAGTGGADETSTAPTAVEGAQADAPVASPAEPIGESPPLPETRPPVPPATEQHVAAPPAAEPPPTAPQPPPTVPASTDTDPSRPQARADRSPPAEPGPPPDRAPRVAFARAAGGAELRDSFEPPTEAARPADGSDSSSPGPGAGPASNPWESGNRPTASSELIDAYRMRLAGANQAEIDAYLRRRAQEELQAPTSGGTANENGPGASRRRAPGEDRG